MTATWEATITRAWLGRGPLSNALLPLSWLYAGISALHRRAFNVGLLRINRLPVPVIVVGNLIAGGSGKTPTVLGVVAHLRSKGFQPGIISRGYGGQHQSAVSVDHHSPASLVGDEPLLLHKISGAPVVVGRDRFAAGLLLLRLHPETTHLVCDDGMQHYRLYRDLEICVFDARGMGNGRLLPAGMLRQHWPPQPVKGAGQSEQRLLVLKTGPSSLQGHLATRTLAPVAINGLGESISLESIRNSAVAIHALAGIAQPEIFFTMLREAGLPLQTTQALPDHHAFDNYKWAPQQQCLMLCTEKDAVKLWRRYPQAWAVRLHQTLPDSFTAAFDAWLRSSGNTPLSFHHGHTTH